jgi:hypothetical protein
MTAMKYDHCGGYSDGFGADDPQATDPSRFRGKPISWSQRGDPNLQFGRAPAYWVTSPGLGGQMMSSVQLENLLGRPITGPSGTGFGMTSHWTVPISYRGITIGKYRPGMPFDWSGTLGFAAGAITAVTLWGGFWPAMLLGGVGGAVGHNIAKAMKRKP